MNERLLKKTPSQKEIRLPSTDIFGGYAAILAVCDPIMEKTSLSKAL